MGERPIRIQRKRSKGWKMPENTVYVGRPTKYGNGFKAGDIHRHRLATAAATAFGPLPSKGGDGDNYRQRIAQSQHG